MAKARIKLISTDKALLDDMCNQIKDIASKAKVKCAGPIPLPRKALKIPTRLTPDGEGRETYETWEMRIFKRLIDIEANEKALKYIMRIPIPKEVDIEIHMLS